MSAVPSWSPRRPSACSCSPWRSATTPAAASPPTTAAWWHATSLISAALMGAGLAGGSVNAIFAESSAGHGLPGFHRRHPLPAGLAAGTDGADPDQPDACATQRRSGGARAVLVDTGLLPRLRHPVAGRHAAVRRLGRGAARRADAGRRRRRTGAAPAGLDDGPAAGRHRLERGDQPRRPPARRYGLCRLCRRTRGARWHACAARLRGQQPECVGDRRQRAAACMRATCSTCGASCSTICASANATSWCWAPAASRCRTASR
jgi:hypothetical protein